ncbi:MAG: hypothetical protein HZB38_09665 [Planctomycetes bacterium]|nr:hypothetical protein [Planctomycetota bacterium]
MLELSIITACLLLGGPPSDASGQAAADSRAAAREAIAKGVAFLVGSQNEDGSWGGPRGAIWTFTGDVWSNPETHRVWKVATTGLAVIALARAELPQTREACERGAKYLIANVDVHRPSEWDTADCWASIYALEAFAAILRCDWFARDEAFMQAVRRAAAVSVERLKQAEALGGGWGYLEFDQPRTQQPQWSTSFTTAAGMVALFDARSAGLPIDEELFTRARKAVRRCRLPSGAYTYSVPAIPDPRHSEWIDQIKGSLGRTQSCNLALLEAGEAIPEERIRDGLDDLFRYHRFLDIARNRPIPHEAYYYNSGYFYLFGHYYAARLISTLPAPQQEPYCILLRREVIKIQQADGAMYDYDMHAYHKPYGTAYGVMALVESLKTPAP